jgi:hypothetical protein
MNRRELLRAAAVLPLAQTAFVRDVSAQNAYPSRNITMIVPFPAGGQADLAARPVAAALERILGKPVIVDNRAGGAGGSVGNAQAARAEPDGYTLLMTLSSLAVLPEADRLFDRPVAYEVSQFAPVARVLADPTLLAVPASAPWKTLQEFVDDAKKRPGQIPYGSSGPYGTLHVAMEMFAASARHQIAARAVPRRRSCIDRIAQRHGAGLGIGAGHAEAAGRRRQDARAGELGRRAHSELSRSADLQGTRLQGGRVLHLGWAVRARRAAGADHDAPSRSDGASHEGAGSDQDVRDRRQPGRLEKFVTEDSARLIAAVKKIGKVE